MEFFKILPVAIGITLILFTLFMCVTSISEHRYKTAWKALFTSLLSIPFILPFFTFNTTIQWVSFTLSILLVLFCLYLFIPAYFFSRRKENIPLGKIDERTIMFARNELKPDTQRFDDYYKEYPEHLSNDNQFRSLPGLLSEQSKFYKPFPYKASCSTFHTVDLLHSLVDGPVKQINTKQKTTSFKPFIDEWLKRNGVISVGYTKLKDYHWYSVGGRGDRYGKKIEASHSVGIAFTVEMQHDMVAAAPASSIIMESASRYLQAGVIAVQLADFIRQNGYEARAHIDGNYQVVAPLVARDAGLGEIGRMGLLMGQELGPRMRIGVVSTNMELPTDKRKFDDSVEDFCEKCKKCATNCPAQAISDQDQELISGVKRWKINSDACFKYWATAGTDCGRCMSTCPYAHPNNALHNLVRWTIKNFPNFRYWAVKLDDYFYGSKPSPAKLPSWLNS